LIHTDYVSEIPFSFVHKAISNKSFFHNSSLLSALILPSIDLLLAGAYLPKHMRLNCQGKEKKKLSREID
jgi:hypothetical protein